MAFSADGRWLFSMAADERARSKDPKGRSNDLKATTSPLCAWRFDDAKLKAGVQPRSAHLRLAMKEKVRLVPHPEELGKGEHVDGEKDYDTEISEIWIDNDKDNNDSMNDNDRYMDRYGRIWIDMDDILIIT